MKQTTFMELGLEARYAKLNKRDPLVELGRTVPWEMFRPRLEAAWRKPSEERKSSAGRKPWDAVLMFKMLVLKALYNVSDERLEDLVADRLTFTRFVGLSMDDPVPDARTIWAYRERLSEAGVMRELFEEFDQYLRKCGYEASKGQILDATLVPVPVQRHTGAEREALKAGEVPGAWMENPNVLRQKERDARWTKKGGRSHYGYKNHVNVDRACKLIRNYRATAADVHDSRPASELVDPENTGRSLWGDAAYRSEAFGRELKGRGYEDKTHRKGQRNRPLGKREREWNRARSRVRARVEHVFGAQVNEMGGKLMRGIGMQRAETWIGLRNLTYNMRRLVQLEKLAATRA